MEREHELQDVPAEEHLGVDGGPQRGAQQRQHPQALVSRVEGASVEADEEHGHFAEVKEGPREHKRVERLVLRVLRVH
eukprot:CAMPEP_0119371660 /NCGR_PEP_ID=MMETSP1334-20130426/17778_1 /TAXON_ID=127549 /ORGANISM="Calcidiscus leptoporus, Strain RCC1130" /LENGTH=77 /DNA_ID=CAMNT_0007388971 /DNA_START=58 /DNA_END=291 /DNA_ORIENTATION=+